jgi:hypothetical protein
MVVIKRHGYQYALNERLIERQGLTEEAIKKLVNLHYDKLDIYQTAKNTKDNNLLKELATKLREVEFAMQEAWGFKRDATYHEWYNIPKCTCAKLDNYDLRGTKYSIVDALCPVHGS